MHKRDISGRDKEMRDAKRVSGDHRRERLVSLVRLSSELALPVGKNWSVLLALLELTDAWVDGNLLALVLV